MTYEEHIRSCQERALKCLDQGDLEGAYFIMRFDLFNHPESHKRYTPVWLEVTTAAKVWWGGGYKAEFREFFEGIHRLPGLRDRTRYRASEYGSSV